MGALDCVTNDRIKSTESTEVFTINVGSNSCLDEPRRDLESQFSKSNSNGKHSVFWTIGVDIPLVIIVLIAVGLIELGVIPSHKAGFYCNDPALSLPYKGDTVSAAVLGASIFLLPLLVFFVTEYIFLNSSYLQRSRFHQAVANTLWVYRGYAYGLFMNFVVCELTKITLGAPRPSFFDVCQPNVTCQGSEYVSSFECTPSDTFSTWSQRDSYRSFFSGHASLSMHCGLFICWYLQCRAFSWSHRVVFLVPFLQALMLAYAVLCSVTRITDNKHHWWDVLAGVGAGIVSVLYSTVVLCDNFKYVMRSDLPEDNRGSNGIVYNGVRPELIS